MPIGGNISGGGGGGGEESSWEERYVVDWSAESAHDWDANASPHAIQGAEWAGLNMANCSKCEIVPASGLEIAPDATVASEWFSTITCPRVYAKLTDWAPYSGLYPAAGDLQAICFQALIEGNVTQDHSGYGMSITAGGGQNVGIERMFSSAVWAGGSNSGYRSSTSYNGGPAWSALNSAEDGSTYELFEIIIFPGSLALCSIRDESEFVDPLGSSVWKNQLSANQYNGNDETQNSWLPDDFYPQFFAYNGSLTTHTITVKSFRVLSLGVV